MNKNISLDYYFWELPAKDATAHWWSQASGCFHRIFFIKEELEKLAEKKDLQTLVTGLSYHLENYFYRVYELRERIIGCLVAITKDNEITKLKSRKLRKSVITRLNEKNSELSDCVEQFLEQTDDAIALRNRHTHDQLLNIGINMNNEDILDIGDVIENLEHNPVNSEKKKAISKNLRKKAVAFSRQYCTGIEKICEITQRFLGLTSNYL